MHGNPKRWEINEFNYTDLSLQAFCVGTRQLEPIGPFSVSVLARVACIATLALTGARNVRAQL